jgi:hypothetical protein
MSMKSLLSLVAAAAMTVSTAEAATHVEFSGSFCITAANSTCTANGWTVGKCGATRYLPFNVGDDGTTTRLDVFFRTYAIDTYSPSANLVGLTYQPMTVTKVAGSGYQFSANARISAQSPVSPTNTTEFITMSGDVQNWDGITGCDISFKAAHTHCPETYC